MRASLRIRQIRVKFSQISLNGKHYEAKVAMGDSFKKGDELLKFDIEAIKKEGYPIITPVIVTNSFEYKEIKAESEKPVTFGDKIFEAFR